MLSHYIISKRFHSKIRNVGFKAMNAEFQNLYDNKIMIFKKKIQ